MATESITIMSPRARKQSRYNRMNCPMTLTTWTGNRLRRISSRLVSSRRWTTCSCSEGLLCRKGSMSSHSRSAYRIIYRRLSSSKVARGRTIRSSIYWRCILTTLSLSCTMRRKSWYCRRRARISRSWGRGTASKKRTTISGSLISKAISRCWRYLGWRITGRRARRGSKMGSWGRDLSHYSRCMNNWKGFKCWNCKRMSIRGRKIISFSPKSCRCPGTEAFHVSHSDSKPTMST